MVCLQINLARSHHSDETNLNILRKLVPRLEELLQQNDECARTLCDSDLDTLIDSDFEDTPEWDRETIPIE